MIAAIVAWVSLRVVGSIHDSPNHLSHRARAQLEILGAKIEQFREHTGTVPNDLRELTVPGKMGPYARSADLLDPWNASFYYRPLNNGSGFVLFTLGSDGRLGGRQDARDVAYKGLADGR
ncbi:type II secretion system protein GspG [Montanilutibacter psychrotolerans]|uniref:type II secretion system protein GspG n=1 Tax=Montanilutibacter psychrotolerans TaxID=1327343 RepID=UPI0016806E29